MARTWTLSVFTRPVPMRPLLRYSHDYQGFQQLKLEARSRET